MVLPGAGMRPSLSRPEPDRFFAILHWRPERGYRAFALHSRQPRSTMVTGIYSITKQALLIAPIGDSGQRVNRAPVAMRQAQSSSFLTIRATS
jgi:hypothetical protein